MSNYHGKYLKYKIKYLDLKEQIGKGRSKNKGKGKGKGKKKKTVSPKKRRSESAESKSSSSRSGKSGNFGSKVIRIQNKKTSEQRDMEKMNKYKEYYKYLRNKTSLNVSNITNERIFKTLEESNLKFSDHAQERKSEREERELRLLAAVNNNEIYKYNFDCIYDRDGRLTLRSLFFTPDFTFVTNIQKNVVITMFPNSPSYSKFIQLEII